MEGIEDIEGWFAIRGVNRSDVFCTKKGKNENGLQEGSGGGKDDGVGCVGRGRRCTREMVRDGSGRWGGARAVGTRGSGWVRRKKMV